MKPFNLEEAKKGAKVCTRDGKKVRIVCFDVKNENHPILALLEEDGQEYLVSYDKDGYFSDDKSNDDLDLFMATEKHEGWVNIYKNNEQYLTGGIWKNENDALQHKDEDYITTTKIEWEE